MNLHEKKVGKSNTLVPVLCAVGTKILEASVLISSSKSGLFIIHTENFEGLGFIRRRIIEIIQMDMFK